jgi:hypothetical protein
MHFLLEIVTLYCQGPRPGLTMAVKVTKTDESNSVKQGENFVIYTDQLALDGRCEGNGRITLKWIRK